jgi:hypothetical protein
LCHSCRGPETCGSLSLRWARVRIWAGISRYSDSGDEPTSAAAKAAESMILFRRGLAPRALPRLCPRFFYYASSTTPLRLPPWSSSCACWLAELSCGGGAISA